MVDHHEIVRLPPAQAAEKALQRPSHYMRYRDANQEMFVTWGSSGFGRSRDSDALEESNFRVIRDDLMKRFPDDVEVEHASHWAVGWVDSITVRILKVEQDDVTEDNLTDVFRACLAWHRKLADYPCASEEDYSREESERDAEAWTSWGARAFEEYIAQAMGLGRMDIEDAAWTAEVDWRTALRNDLEGQHRGNDIFGSWYSGEPSLNEKELDKAIEQHLLALLKSLKWWWLGRQVEVESCIEALRPIGVAREKLEEQVRHAQAANHKDQRKIVGN